jgi:ATP-dependent exoDNAse (exonuclease V) alpha subunit
MFIGDINQLGAISAGKPFERFVERANKAGELIIFNENYRQKDPELREAIDLAKKGKMKECLDIIDTAKNGGIIEVQDRLDRRIEVSHHYDNETLILANTRAAKIDLDDLIRNRLIKENIIERSKEQVFELKEKDDDGIDVDKQMKLTIGDKIVFTQNDYQKYPDNEIRNGQRAEITSITDNEITYKNEAGKEFKIDTEEYPYIDYGYAMTTYKSQGQTFNKVVIDADTAIASLNDMRNAYVNITRCREDIKIYTDDKDYFKNLAQERRIEKDTMDVLYATTRKETSREYEKKESKGAEETLANEF